MTLREWLEAEYEKARLAASRSRGALGGSLGQHKHCSAVSRMCALGEVMDILNGADVVPVEPVLCGASECIAECHNLARGRQCMRLSNGSIMLVDRATTG